MPANNLGDLRLSERDLNFLVETVAPDAGDKTGLKNIIRKDIDFRNSFVGDDKIFRLPQI